MPRQEPGKPVGGKGLYGAQGTAPAPARTDKMQSKPFSPGASPQHLLLMVTPWLTGRSSDSPLVAGGKFLLLGHWVPRPVVSPSAGSLPEPAAV